MWFLGNSKFAVSGGKITLTDLQNTGGTFLNDERATEPVPEVNNLIRLSNTLLEVEAVEKQGRAVAGSPVIQ